MLHPQNGNGFKVIVKVLELVLTKKEHYKELKEPSYYCEPLSCNILRPVVFYYGIILIKITKKYKGN